MLGISKASVAWVMKNLELKNMLVGQSWKLGEDEYFEDR